MCFEKVNPSLERLIGGFEAQLKKKLLLMLA